jgi:NAD(P)-dependent dehydrogenase (short-subunit alcohol dehydrogenase family)
MRVWFITGASRGFGALIAAEALAQGDAVVATARDPNAVTARLGTHERLLATRLDVTSETEAHEAAGQAVKKFGRIDVLVNNAGYGLLGAIEEASAKEVERLYATNVFGLLRHPRRAAAYAPTGLGSHYEHFIRRRICRLPRLGRLWLDQVRGRRHQ